MLTSKKNKYNYHEIPGEWLEQCRRIETDFRRYVSEVNIRAIIATKGGPNVGHRWRGTVRLEFTPHNYGLLSSKTITRYIYLTKISDFGKEKTYIHRVEDLRQAWDKVKAEILTIESGKRIVALYRKSGLIPKHIARKHQAKAKEKFGEKDQFGRVVLNYYSDKNLISWLTKRFSHYVAYFAKCPTCKKRRTFIESILGWTCDHCGAVLCDVYDVAWAKGRAIKY